MVATKRDHLKANAQAILEAYNVMECQLLNVGAKDLAAGYDFIQSLQQQANFPFISANIRRAGHDDLLFTPSTIIETHDRTLGFVGVSGGNDRLKDFSFIDPVGAAQAAVDGLKDRVDLVFLLANVDDGMESRLIKEVVDVDFLIRSGTGRRYAKPKFDNDKIVVRNGNQGKYAGMLEVRLDDPNAELKDISQQMKRIKFADSRINAMMKDVPEDVTLEEHFADNDKKLQLINRLKNERSNNEGLIEKLGNTFYFNPIALDEKIMDTPEVSEIVAEFLVDRTVAKGEKQPPPKKGK